MKPYVKPELYYESFELAQHIAGCYIHGVNQTDPATCIFEGEIDGFPSDSWFLTKGVCTTVSEDYCVTNSTINMNTISS